MSPLVSGKSFDKLRLLHIHIYEYITSYSIVKHHILLKWGFFKLLRVPNRYCRRYLSFHILAHRIFFKTFLSCP